MRLDVQNVTSGYGKLQVLHGVNLAVDAGGITCVLGPNGAGKSTLMKTVSRHLPLASGDIVYENQSLKKHSALAATKMGIGYVPQDGNVFRDLTVQENLFVSGLAFNQSRKRTDEILEFLPRLAERGKQKAATLSGGERQMLAIANALIAQPRLLLLDEPTAGLAPFFVERIIEWIKALAADGVSVVWVVEQNPDKILAVSDMTYIMDGGQNKETIESSQLLASGLVEAAITGGSIRQECE